MKRKEMIKDRKLFNHIINNGNFQKNKYFVIYNDKTENQKFGIAISKKYGNAVERNKIKRKVRVIIDNNRNLFQKELDYIIMIRKNCQNASFNALESSFIELLKG